MILSQDEFTTTQSTDNWVVGKAKNSKGFLKKGEIVMQFGGVRSILGYIGTEMNEAKQDKSSLGFGGGHAGNMFDSYEEAMTTFIKKPESIVKYSPTEIRAREFGEQGNDLMYDVTGDFIDVGRVLEGVPETFGSLHNGNPRSRRVRMVVGLSQGASMKPGEINHRSERIIRLVDALEGANIRTELTAIDTNGCSHTEITVKRFDESLTIEDVAISTSVDFFRRMLFRVSEYSDTWNHGYGRSDVLRNNINLLKSQLNDELTIFIDGNMRDREIDSAFDILEKKLEDELSEEVPTLTLVTVDYQGVRTERL